MLVFQNVVFFIKSNEGFVSESNGNHRKERQQ